MSDSTTVDVRVPIGALFATLGLLLGVYGLVARGSASASAGPSVAINVWWGGVMLVFGALMLLSAARARRPAAARPALETAEGRAIEKREADQGLER